MKGALFGFLAMVMLAAVACATATPYPTHTPYPTATNYPTYTPYPTATNYPTYTPYPTATNYPTSTPYPTATNYPTSTPYPTNTPYPTATPRPTYTPYPTPTAIPLPTPTPFVIRPNPPTPTPRAGRVVIPTPVIPPPTQSVRPRPLATPPYATPPVLSTQVVIPPTPPATPPPIECGEDCAFDAPPVISSVEWVRKPRIEDGRFSFAARIDGYDLTFPSNRGGVANVAFDVGGRLYGSILPPSGQGWDWTPRPNQWIADTYEFAGGMFTVSAQVSPAAANQSGLQVCLWTGGHHSQAENLGCIRVD